MVQQRAGCRGAISSGAVDVQALSIDSLPTASARWPVGPPLGACLQSFPALAWIPIVGLMVLALFASLLIWLAWALRCACSLCKLYACTNPVVSCVCRAPVQKEVYALLY